LRASAELDHKDWRSAVSINAVIFRVPHERAVADRMRASALLRVKPSVPKQLTSPRSIAAAVLWLKATNAAWLARLVEDLKYYLMAL
jgi:hypothetical protein